MSEFIFYISIIYYILYINYFSLHIYIYIYSCTYSSFPYLMNKIVVPSLGKHLTSVEEELQKQTRLMTGMT